VYARETHDKLFNCGVCDLLAEVMHLELQGDAKRSRESQEAGMRKISAGGQQNGQIRVALDPRATVRRMVESTNGYGESIESWKTLDPLVIKEAKRVLQQNAAAFADGFMGIPLRQHHTQVWVAKQKICGKNCGAFMPRHRNFNQNSCGWCQETMRDIAIIWSLQAREGLSSTKLDLRATSVIDSICESIPLRHSPTYSAEIKTACNELVEDHGRAVVAKLTSLSTNLSRAVTIVGQPTPGPRDAYEYWRYIRAISPAICEGLTGASDLVPRCRPGEVKVDLIPEVIPRELRDQYEAQQKKHIAMAEAEKKHSEMKGKDINTKRFQEAMVEERLRQEEESQRRDRMKSKEQQEKVETRSRRDGKVESKAKQGEKKRETEAPRTPNQPTSTGSRPQSVTQASPPHGQAHPEGVRRVGGTAVRATSRRTTKPTVQRGGARVVHRAEPSRVETASQTAQVPVKKRNVGGAALLRMASRVAARKKPPKDRDRGDL